MWLDRKWIFKNLIESIYYVASIFFFQRVPKKLLTRIIITNIYVLFAAIFVNKKENFVNISWINHVHSIHS